MNTNSFVVQKIIAFFIVLNQYFENSYVSKIFASMGKASKTSKIVCFFKNSVCVPQKINYFEGSLIIKAGTIVVILIMNLAKKLYVWLKKLNTGSLNKAVFHMAIAPLNTLTGALQAAFFFLTGVFMVLTFYGIFTKSLFVLYAVLFMLFGNLGLYCSDVVAKGLQGCIPVRLVKWFFNEE